MVLNDLHFLDRPTHWTLKLHIYDCRTNEYFKNIIFYNNDDGDDNEDDNNGDVDNENMYTYFGDEEINSV